MNEKPILFSGPMIRAILAGQKTQTRRVVKIKARIEESSDDVWFEDMYGDWHRVTELSPYGQPGDRLWVREFMHMDKDGVWLYSADDDFVGCDRADESAMISWAHHKESEHCPSIHMPRWASRITLEITGVRVGRLQDITASDMQSEGIECLYEDNGEISEHFTRQSWVTLWDRINAKRGCGWDINPWVWVISFKPFDR